MDELVSSRKVPKLGPEIEAVFSSYPEPIQEPILRVRSLVFQVAEGRNEIGLITETLKWGQVSYLTEVTKSGTTLRLAPVKKRLNHFGLYVHCQTQLIERSRDIFSVEAAQGVFEFEKNRGLILECGKPLPVTALSLFINHALTYHL
ncbi:DUF1801 domain-containing protein [Roseibium algae]|uniref:DUF1801 domain-containing protein n=1 Tax=Roseibium algae TaxID=3123038 RepID=A0ABU8TP18_9HYPH